MGPMGQCDLNFNLIYFPFEYDKSLSFEQISINKNRAACCGCHSFQVARFSITLRITHSRQQGSHLLSELLTFFKCFTPHVRDFKVSVKFAQL